MDMLYYSFKELKFGACDLTSDELLSLVGAEAGSLVGFRGELFEVSSINPLSLVLRR